MARILKNILKSGLHSYSAQNRLIGFPHTNIWFRTRKEALTLAKWTETKTIQDFPLI